MSRTDRFLKQVFAPSTDPTVIVAVGELLFSVTKTEVWMVSGSPEDRRKATSLENRLARERVAQILEKS